MKRKRTESGGSQRRIVVFVHVPKAAGTTLRRLMDRQYPKDSVQRCDMQLHPDAFDELRNLPPDQVSNLRCLIGHLPFGIHEFLPLPVDYVTILRDPVDRFLSKYGYLQNNQWVADELGLEEKQLSSLEAFVDAQLERNAMNVQCRQISGSVDFENPMPPFARPVTAEMLAQAKNNLEHEFAVVGLQEKFDESLLLMRKAFGWNDVSYQRRNVTPGRARQNKASSRVRELILEHNSLDRELFEFAKRLFVRQIPAYGPGFKNDLKTLERQNERKARKKRIRYKARKLVRRVGRRLSIRP